MHRALELDDILYTIIDHVASFPRGAYSTLGALAITSRLWSEHALNRLWANLKMEMLPALAMTMESRYWKIKEDSPLPGHRLVVFRNGAIDNRWMSERFKSYCRRVRVVSFEVTFRSLLFSIDEPIIGAWAQYCYRQQLFSNIDHLKCYLDNPTHDPGLFHSDSFRFVKAILATTNSISHLTLTMPTVTKQTEDAILEMTLANLDNISTLTLKSRMPENGLSSSLFLRLPNLKTLVSDYAIPTTGLQALSKLDHLETYHIKSLLSGPPLTPGFFNIKFLRIPLETTTELRISMDALSSLNLTTIDCNFAQPPSYDELYSLLPFIRNRYPNLTQLHLKASETKPLSVLGDNVIELMKELSPTLRSLSLEMISPKFDEDAGDIERFIDACSPTLRELKFAETHGIRAARFLALARRFPASNRQPPLHLQIDAPGIPILIASARDEGPVSTSMTVMDCRGKLSAEDDIPSLARAITDLFPSLFIVFGSPEAHLTELQGEIQNIFSVRKGNIASTWRASILQAANSQLLRSGSRPREL